MDDCFCFIFSHILQQWFLCKKSYQISSSAISDKSAPRPSAAHQLTMAHRPSAAHQLTMPHHSSSTSRNRELSEESRSTSCSPHCDISMLSPCINIQFDLQGAACCKFQIESNPASRVRQYLPRCQWTITAASHSGIFLHSNIGHVGICVSGRSSESNTTIRTPTTLTFEQVEPKWLQNNIIYVQL